MVRIMCWSGSVPPCTTTKLRIVVLKEIIWVTVEWTFPDLSYVTYRCNPTQYIFGHFLSFPMYIFCQIYVDINGILIFRAKVSRRTFHKLWRKPRQLSYGSNLHGFESSNIISDRRVWYSSPLKPSLVYSIKELSSLNQPASAVLRWNQ